MENATLLPAGVERASDAVVIEGLDPRLLDFLRILGLVCLHLFDAPVIVTSAVWGDHTIKTRHALGFAVDVCLNSAQVDWQTPFAVVVGTLAARLQARAFDSSRVYSKTVMHVEFPA